MKIYYDSKNDLLRITLRNSDEVRNERYNEDVVLDVDKEGRVVGLEILDASDYLELENLLSVTVIQEKSV